MAEQARTQSEWATGWKVAVAAMAGFSLSATFTFTFGAFIEPLEAEFGWSRGDIALGMSMITLVGALLSPPIGMLVDRWGPRRFGVPGALVFAAGFGTLGLTTGNILVWWGLWFLLAFAFIMIKPLIWSTAVASTFDKQRGLAFAVAMCGNGIASTFTPSLATWAIADYGWRLAFPIVGGIVGLITFPILFFFLHSGADKALAKNKQGAVAATAGEAGKPALYGLTTGEALRKAAFYKIGLAAFLFTVAAIGLVPNMIPILSSFDISRTEAAAIAGVAGISSIVGRLVTGVLLDRFNPNIIAGFVVLLPVVSCLLLLGSPGNVPVAVLAAVVIGVALGSEVDVIAFLTARQFGTLRYGTIFGVMSGLWALATATGPFLVNRSYDVTGSYVLAIESAIPLFLVTSLLLFTLGRAPDFGRSGSVH
ncbi:MAG: MFS transporter [Novosphingobium sp.]|nr:MFS transporter [Novosphingobium sp.]